MVKAFIALVLFLLPTVAQAVIEYRLEVELVPAEQRLQATAIITLDEGLTSPVEFRLSDKCEVIAVEQDSETIRYTFTNGRLNLELRNRSAVIIRYRGSFTDPVSTTPVHNEDPSYGVSAVISPDGTFLSAAADWYPRLATEDIHYRIMVTSPAGIEAVTSGRRLQHQSDALENLSTWEVDYPLYGLTLSAGNYQVVEDHSGSMPIFAYFYSQSAHLASVYLQEARLYLALYEELFGPYPFHKFAIVENFFPTGYGFPSWTLLGSSVIRLPFIVKTSLGHEIAHSWWGTGVRVDYSEGNWAEGLTTYVADYLYKERSSAKDALEYRLKILRDYAGLVSPENAFPLEKFLSRKDKASQAIGYGKAAMLFHMLRKQVGEKIFWSVLRKIVRENRFSPVAWSDFAQQYSLAAEQDLTPFFSQWLQNAAGPKLALQNVHYQKHAEGYLLEGQITQEEPFYRLAIELLVETENGSKSHPVQLQGSATEFALTTTERPNLLRADPQADLFRILATEEIPPAVNAARASRNLLAIDASEYAPPREAMKTLLAALRKPDLPIRDLASVSDTELAEHDLLIFGSSDSLRPEELTEGKIKLVGTEFAIDAKSVFVVAPHPSGNGRVAAWFLSDDASQAAVVARKIPHYGKYSYLLFDGAKNTAKGTLPPESSPLAVKFTQ